MVQGFPFYHWEKCFILWGAQGSGLEPLKTEVEEGTFGQSIAREDCCDKTIFDGDIFSLVGSPNKIVRYIEDRTGFAIANIDDLKSESYWDIWHFPEQSWWKAKKDSIKIIGNIHQNKELLNGQQYG